MKIRNQSDPLLLVILAIEYPCSDLDSLIIERGGCGQQGERYPCQPWCIWQPKNDTGRPQHKNGHKEYMHIGRMSRACWICLPHGEGSKDGDGLVTRCFNEIVDERSSHVSKLVRPSTSFKEVVEAASIWSGWSYV